MSYNSSNIDKLEHERIVAEADFVKEVNLRRTAKTAALAVGGVFTLIWGITFLSLGATAGGAIGIFVGAPLYIFLIVLMMALSYSVSNAEGKLKQKEGELAQAYLGGNLG